MNRNPDRDSKLDRAIARHLPSRLISFRSVDAPFPTHGYFCLDHTPKGIKAARVSESEPRDDRGILASVVSWVADRLGRG